MTKRGICTATERGRANETFSCGHTGTVQLYGKGDERERKIRYFEEYGVCSECYKERRAKKQKLAANM